MKTEKILLAILIIFIMVLIVLVANIFFISNKEKKNMNPIVVLETTKGNIEIELDPVNAPVTVENFLSYVNSGFYDGLVFHRVIKDFMIQGGGFDTSGKQKDTNAPIVLESDNNLFNMTGTIAMARTTAPNSATSQFFINTADNDRLNYSLSNPGYAVFGKVISGMEVVRAIESVSTSDKAGHEDWPIENIVITKARVK
jgi:peptidyl-prolyl cis-trans isomerase B (cyclophilin B)